MTAEGERQALASTPPPILQRHEHDELYNLALVEGLASDVMVLAGPDGPPVVGPDTYRRLAADLTGNGVRVVADLSGDELEAVMTGKPYLLKVSHEDLVEHGHAASENLTALVWCRS